METKINTADQNFQVKTDRVVVFKDGYCMFVKKITGKLDMAGRIITETIPEAMVLGSFWVIPENGKLTSVIAKQQIISRKARQETEKCLVFEFDSDMAGKNVEVNLIYFGPGLRWIPTYRIALEDGEKCHLMMQAEILNEAEDLEGVPMDLVVGVPNFRFKETISPLSLESSLRNTLRETAPQLESQMMSNVLISQRRGEVREGVQVQHPSSAVPALPSELAGEGSQDLFLYKISKLSLRAGERAAIPLISAETPFKHLYTWDVHLTHSNVDVLPGKGLHISPVKLIRNEIWHQIELVNQTNVPWTTGAVLVMEGFLPLSQELLTYTSIGDVVQIPLSVAIDIRGTYTEEEIGRDTKAIRFDGYDYIRIMKRGTLTVTNYKKESIDIIITCDLGGNAEEASLDGKITISDFQREDWSDFRGSPALTGHSTIEWKFQLAASETRELTCDYYYYTR
ncbi:MAG: hypothetical protein ACFFC7_28250 [Candidatus Hermodarchaeota archaeon]